jgi:hypothetical protein
MGNNNMKKNYFEIIRIILDLMLIGALVGGLYINHAQLKQDARGTRYMYLAGVWNDIMKESIQYPQFNDKSKTLVYRKAFSGDEQREYTSYIRWIGGFVEDLYFHKYQEKGDLYYEPWVETILETHSTWFINHMQYYKYTPGFYNRLLDMKERDSISPRQATPNK